MKNLFRIIFILFITTISVDSQDFGGHPSNVKWKQINSKNVKVIYPDSLDDVAKRIADVVEHINKNNTYSVGEKSRKLDIILQTNRVNSNGFVALAPFQSEFYSTSVQDTERLGTTDWLDLLSIHEYRHALQLANIDRGFTKVLHIVFGQKGWAIGAFISLPDWYFEGDATLSETLLSNSGRGRTPNFFIEQRANILNGKDYPYMTARNGSLKKIIPNRYRLGFAITNYTRNHYGMDVWKKITADAGRYRSVFYPFSGAMNRHTGKHTRDMYSLAYDKLKKDWEAELDSIKLTPKVDVIERKAKAVTNYQFPQLLENGNIIAIKNSFREINHLVEIENGVEKKLTNYGIVPQLFLSENKGVLAWAELKLDARRSNRNYTKIVTYNRANGEKNYVNSKSKYFSPHVSSTGEKIVVVEANEKNKNQIHILDSKKGNVLLKIPNLENDFFSYPKWIKNDESIVYIVKRNSMLALVKFDFATAKETMLTDWTSHTIGISDIGKENIYFSASFSGIDNIYSVNLNGDKKIKQISSVKIGANQPTISLDEKSFVVSELSTNGFELSKIDITESLSEIENISYSEPKDQIRYNIKTNPNEENILDSIQKSEYNSKPYNGLKGIKLHSWGVKNLGNNPIFNLEFTNTLRDIDGNIGAIFNVNEGTTNFIGKVGFCKWFTEIGLEAKYLNRNINYFSSNTFVDESFNERNFSGYLSVPLRWVKGNYFVKFQPSAKYTQHITSENKDEPSLLGNLNFGTLTAQTDFSILRTMAKQNIFPRLGVYLSTEYQSSVSTIDANRFIVNGAFFLPGISKNHSIKIDANHQKELATNEFQFTDLFFYSRGYDAILNDEATRIAFNYTLPLAYPDWGFGGLTYFKRIRANLFYDMGNIQRNKSSFDLNSYGFEVLFDNVYLNAIPLTVGLRQSYLLNADILNSSKKSDFELFFFISF